MSVTVEQIELATSGSMADLLAVAGHDEELAHELFVIVRGRLAQSAMIGDDVQPAFILLAVINTAAAIVVGLADGDVQAAENLLPPLDVYMRDRVTEIAPHWRRPEAMQ